MSSIIKSDLTINTLGFDNNLFNILLKLILRFQKVYYIKYIYDICHDVKKRKYPKNINAHIYYVLQAIEKKCLKLAKPVSYNNN